MHCFFAQSFQPKPDASADRNARWKPIQFLLGSWTAEGGGSQTGQGQGAFSFTPDLDRSIVVRRNFAEYRDGPNAGTRHDDLLIMYSETPDSFRAIYFDSEGHVIRYKLKTPVPNVAVFESDGTQPGPKYRLSYTLNGKVVDGKIRNRRAGLAEFKPYLSWSPSGSRRLRPKFRRSADRSIGGSCSKLSRPRCLTIAASSGEKTSRSSYGLSIRGRSVR